MAQGFSLVILGIIAASSLALASKPNAKELIHKVVPFQGWIGLGFCFWGIYCIISNNFLNIDQLQVSLVDEIASLCVNIMQMVLGYLLGYSMVLKFVFAENKEIRRKGDLLLIKAAPLHGKLGVAAIFIGLGSILNWTFF